jgi:ribose/xylose/arabinose/galactoside ABC-type transport system permease subunit
MRLAIVVAVGVTFGVIARVLDLSRFSIALSGVYAAFQASQTSAALSLESPLPCLLVYLMVIIAKSDIVIVTLAAYMEARCLALALTEKLDNQSPVVGFMTRLPDWFPAHAADGAFIHSGFVLLNKTRLGRYTFAMGGMSWLLMMAGVRTDLYKLVFLTSGFMVGIASMLRWREWALLN